PLLERMRVLVPLLRRPTRVLALVPWLRHLTPGRPLVRCLTQTRPWAPCVDRSNRFHRTEAVLPFRMAQVPSAEGRTTWPLASLPEPARPTGKSRAPSREPIRTLMVHSWLS